ncbi:MAG: glycosyl transferase family 1 [Flavobacterium sp.]|nr:glycosyl transferase family 1 [Flavobacterium sp.]
MKVLVLTRYSRLGASSRYRMFQYLPLLEKNGIQVEIHSLLDDTYINALYGKARIPFFAIIKSYWKRIQLLLNKGNYDLIWLQQEAFPWLPTFVETYLLGTKTPLVVDYDDAFFHRYDQHKNPIVRFVLRKKIDRIMEVSSVVVVCNDYLAQRAKDSKAERVELLPTVIDLKLYKTKQQCSEKTFTIGWVGSPHTVKYLDAVKPSLIDLLKDENVKVVILGSGKYNLPGAQFIEWQEETEIENIRTFDVGIMPLDNTSWERGKCGFKLIQYMACGIPVIASPIEINTKIVNHKVNGFLAETLDGWADYFKQLKDNPQLRIEMGLQGRKTVEENYTLEVNAPKLINILKSVVRFNG